jgi:hypothetical protein
LKEKVNIIPQLLLSQPLKNNLNDFSQLSIPGKEQLLQEFHLLLLTKLNHYLKAEYMTKRHRK